jgi:GT2 family glycosyltransferase
MEISFLIVTRNRPEELAFTLTKLKSLINLDTHEVCVFVDGCPATELIINDFNWVKWTISKKSISASPARAQLYKKALGTVFIGLDDDAHPLTNQFISSVETEFQTDKSIGVLAFQEVRGVFKSDTEALTHLKDRESYFTSDFVGCGFAMSKIAYQSIVGFPNFIDIYGEEPCVGLQILDAGFNIKYVPHIAVNHRVDTVKRKQLGRNYFRFEKQLKNSFRFFIVYYPSPFKPVLKLFLHNFKKYALSDVTYFKLFFKVVILEVLGIWGLMKYRNPIKISTLNKMRSLKGLSY